MRYIKHKIEEKTLERYIEYIKESELHWDDIVKKLTANINLIVDTFSISSFLRNIEIDHTTTGCPLCKAYREDVLGCVLCPYYIAHGATCDTYGHPWKAFTQLLAIHKEITPDVIDRAVKMKNTLTTLRKRYEKQLKRMHK